jgi:Transglycosylase SLT domain
MGGLLQWLVMARSRIQGALRRTPRAALTAAGGAVVVMVVCVSLLIAQLQPGGTTQVTRSLMISQPTETATSTSTLVPTATQVPTATRVPVAKPVPTTPPPPPVPTRPPATPTATFCPTATAVPPTATATATTTSTSTSSGATNSLGDQQLAARQAMATCTPCPYYAGNNPSQATLQAALDSAADAYHVPRHLVEAVAWQESKWHEDVSSCDGGLGLMQIQYYNVSWLNSVSVPECNLGSTNYDVNTATGNASLGAKYLAYLACFYSYWGGYSGTASNPASYTIEWYYHQAGLPYPDTTRSDGQPSLCASVFNGSGNAEYPDMPSTTGQPWPCPYSATAGDSTLLDITLSAYNEGPGYTDKYGIQNWGYVDNVEYFIPQFYSSALPVPS